MNIKVKKFWYKNKGIFKKSRLILIFDNNLISKSDSDK